MKLKAINGDSAKQRVVQRARPRSPNYPTPSFYPTSQINPASPENKIKAYTNLIRLRPLLPIPRDTQTSLGLAKFGHLTTLALKNDINRSIIGHSTSFGTNVGYLDFTRLDPTTT
uniref:Uncharacterized protein n=1 Tax=Solanum tuberosum TaxID=4113 RepID=M1DZ53_SOLTU